MKKHFLFFIFSIYFLLVKAQQPGNVVDCKFLHWADPNAPVMTFDTLDFDNGFTTQETIVEHEYHFTNTGKSPLVISKVAVSCYCTAPSFPTEPIAPGRKGTIKIRFDTNGKIGEQNKTATIESNNRDGYIVLHIRACVIASGNLLLFTKTIINGDTFPARDENGKSLGYVFPQADCWADFDTVTAGKQVHIRYQFVNPSKSPLIIIDAKGSAGSVVPSYTKEPIPSLQTGEIDVVFLIDGSVGMQSKTVTVQYFTQDYEHAVTVVLHLQGYVLRQ